MKRYLVNNREYSLDMSKFTVSDLKTLILLHHKSNVEGFNEFCDGVFEKVISKEVFSQLPYEDYSLLSFIFQNEIISLMIKNSMGFSKEDLLDLVTLIEDEEDEISSFLRKIGLDD